MWPESSTTVTTLGSSGMGLPFAAVTIQMTSAPHERHFPR
jgi:hypothetical protein